MPNGGAAAAEPYSGFSLADINMQAMTGWMGPFDGLVPLFLLSLFLSALSRSISTISLLSLLSSQSFLSVCRFVYLSVSSSPPPPSSFALSLSLALKYTLCFWITAVCMWTCAQTYVHIYTYTHTNADSRVREGVVCGGEGGPGRCGFARSVLFLLAR